MSTLSKDHGEGGGSFQETLLNHRLQLNRDRTTVLQVNVGLICNLACRHCHLEAGPARHEAMARSTMEEVIAAARRFRFSTIDITGGAPELVPEIGYLVRALAELTPRLIFRSNLIALGENGSGGLYQLFQQAKPVIVASLPATNASQTDAMRGSGVWDRSIAALKELNLIGYGMPEIGLELDLVSNPSGAFLPPGQHQAEVKFRADLKRKHGISFNTLFTFANVPLGRFRSFLESSGNLEQYLGKLRDGFNPATVSGLMCRSQLCVDWRGVLYDCDFNLAAGLAHGGEPMHISALTELPMPGTPIPVGDHCYACTVGSGFT